MAKKLSDDPFTLDEVITFTREIYAEAEKGSDRAVVMICTAGLDELLRRTLQRFMVDTAVSRNLLASNAPLGTMSARIQIAEALGLITDGDSKCLNIMRDIRNDFAHRLGSDINPDRLRDRVENLRNAVDAVANVDAAAKIVGDVKLMPREWDFKLTFTGACIALVTVLTNRLQSGAIDRRSAMRADRLQRINVDFPDAS